MGAGAALRFIDVLGYRRCERTRCKVGAPRADQIAYAQAVIGVPLGRARLALETFVRYQRAAGDDRLAWSWGVELSTQVGR